MNSSQKIRIITSSAPFLGPQDSSSQQLLSFYDPFLCTPNIYGHRFDEIVSWDDDRIERDHRFIQWLFPLARSSSADEDAPVVDRQILIYVRNHNEILQNMRLAVTRMMRFYGFDMFWDSELRVVISNLGLRNEVYGRWLKDKDHNHNRITRMIQSLRLFSLDDEAEAIYQRFLLMNRGRGSPVSQATLHHWRRAAGDPLVSISQGHLNYQPEFYAYRQNGDDPEPHLY
ncbi:opioid growth factor receptor conserved region-domain-containing protein [Annulohypoxylon bovei var. microspora]|nr:opioid growth factor receptor conserved region-domain-containing protein [Annulohypoxylon bovei var. microspora]